MTSPNVQARPASPGVGTLHGTRTSELPALPLTPPTGEPGGGRAVWRAFRRATAAVHHHADRMPPQHLPADATAVTLGDLVAAVQRSVRGESVVLSQVGAPRYAAALLAALRTAFLDELGRVRESVRPAEIVELLQAIDAVHASIASSGGVDAPESHDRALHVEVAHDMRSPLTSILFLVETLRNKRSGPLTEVQERQLGLVYSAAFALSALANDLIELAPGGDRLLDGDDVPFSVSDVFCGVRDLVLPIAEERRLDLRFSPPDADWRLGRPAPLQRVLVNLTTNALKFTTAGSVTVTARQISRTTIEFSVADTGSGIPPHVMASLYDVPGDGQGDKQRFTSAGLGLALCKKLVRAMGSELRAESAPDSGTRMSFTLDLQLAARF